MIEWFYGIGGQQYGPIDEVTLSARIATGEIGPQDLVWNEGMDTWKPLHEVRHLAPTGNDSQSQDSHDQTPEPPQPSYAPPVEVKAPMLDDASVEEIPQSPYAPPVEGIEGASYTPGPTLPVTNGLAIASLVCGILSVVFFCVCGGLFLGIPAVICGHLSLNQLNTPGNLQQGRGMAIAGLICGYLGIAFFAIMILGGDGSSYQEI
jgi:hypothetical protein